MKKGFVTIQFLLAFIIVMFFVQSFLGLSLTLTHGTLVQYISYSSARKLSLGSTNKSIQIQGAEDKYEELRETFFKQNYKESSGEWFSIPRSVDVGDFNNDYEDSPQHYRLMFYGASVPFTSRVFNFQVPFITNGAKQDLKTTIASYLGREPSQGECEVFFRQVKNKVCRAYGVSNCDAQEQAQAGNGC